MPAADPFDLTRFIEAQGAIYAQVVEELTRGRKQSHWIWFVFPQLRGLGRSATAERFAIASRAEAIAYLAHPVLRSRLIECTSLLLAHAGRRIEHILHDPDHLKFHSCMTLFSEVAPAEPLFAEALEAFFSGKKDEATLRLLDNTKPQNV